MSDRMTSLQACSLLSNLPFHRRSIPPIEPPLFTDERYWTKVQYSATLVFDKNVTLVDQ
jgi:hypothetical protein